MKLISQGKTNWRLLLIVIILISIVGGKTLLYLEEQKNSLSQLLESEKQEKEVIGKSSDQKLLSIQKGIEFLLTTDKKFEGGATIALKEFNNIWKDERLDNLIIEKIPEDFGEKYKFFSRFFTDSNSLDFNLAEVESFSLLDRITAKALNCDRFSCDNIFNDIRQIKKDGGYNSTHNLLAFLIMEERDCCVEKTSVPIAELIEELILVQDNLENENQCTSPEDLKIDIYSERAVFIGEAGSIIKEAWIGKIIDCQQHDGSWADNPHATSLSLWAIAKIQSND